MCVPAACPNPQELAAEKQRAAAAAQNADEEIKRLQGMIAFLQQELGTAKQDLMASE